MLVLAFWIGGIAMIALMAPIVFHSGIDRMIAGDIVAQSLKWFNAISAILGLFLLLSAIADHWLVPSWPFGGKKLNLFRIILILAFLFLLLYLWIGLTPTMMSLRAQKRWTEFDILHRRYVSITNLQLSIAVGTALLTAMINALIAHRLSGTQGQGK